MKMIRKLVSKDAQYISITLKMGIKYWVKDPYVTRRIFSKGLECRILLNFTEFSNQCCAKGSWTLLYDGAHNNSGNRKLSTDMMFFCRNLSASFLDTFHFFKDNQIIFCSLYNCFLLLIHLTVLFL